MARKSGLGRGLDALIQSGESALPAGQISQIPISQIKPNPHQPRSRFDTEELKELSDSIREHGIIQPLIVTNGISAGYYTLIAGERRLLAAQQAGLELVPAIVRDAEERDLVELALVENVQRSDLSPLEAAEAYRQLTEDFHLSHEEIAARVGKSRVAVTNTLRLLKLAPSILEAIADRRISEGHARALLGLPTHQAQAAALQTILQNGLNVRQTEDLVQRLTGQKPSRHVKQALPPEFSALEERLRNRLGTRVHLSRRGRGGTIVIHYFSEEELDDLARRILGSEE